MWARDYDVPTILLRELSIIWSIDVDDWQDSGKVIFHFDDFDSCVRRLDMTLFADLKPSNRHHFY